MEKAVLVSDSGGSHEIVRNGETGVVFRGGDVNGCADSLVHLYERRELRNQLGTEARRFVCEHLDARLSAERMMRIYRGVLSPSANGASSDAEPILAHAHKGQSGKSWGAKQNE